MIGKSRRPSPAMIVACIALIVALGGTGIAASGFIDGARIARNSIPGNRIENGTLPGAKLRPAAITGAKVRPDTLTGRQIKETTLATVPSAANANALGGVPAAGFPTLVPRGIPSGTTVSGAFGTISVANAAGGHEISEVVSLPGVATADLTDTTVNFAPGTGVADADATCTGTAIAPTAPAGKVCLYLSQAQGASTVDGLAIPGLGGSRRGFLVHATAATNLVGAVGTWAYTAP